MLALPVGARANFGVQLFEAGTCGFDIPECSYTSPESQFFTQIGGHPPLGIVHFKFNTDAGGSPEGQVRDVRVDLPPGLSVDPEATPRCTEADLEGPDSPVGEQRLCIEKGAKVGTIVLKPNNFLTLTIPVFNIIPRPGEPAEFGFRFKFGEVDFTTYLEGTVSWDSDYHEGFTIREVVRTVTSGGVPVPLSLLEARLAFDGSAGGGSFLTVGTNCAGSTTSTLTVDSYAAPNVRLPFATTPAGPNRIVNPTGCESVPFDPTIAVGAGATDRTDSPTGLSVTAKVPLDSSKPVAQANLKRAVVTLPRGMGLNPGSVSGLQACSDEQFGQGIAIGDRITDPAAVHPPPLACPAGSAIGTVAIETPVLPKGSLAGRVYLGSQLSSDPLSGKEYRVFLDAENPQLGVYVRLEGEVRADPGTGQLTASFDEPAYGGLPQVPFSSVQIGFDGAKGVLTSPPLCGEHTVTSRLSPWSGKADATSTGGFTLSSAPGGGKCAKTMAERPFAPGFSAKLRGPAAGAYNPLQILLTRSEGQQELKGVDVTLPPGVIAKLAGVSYCPEAAIAAAEGNAGLAERRSPSCPQQSRIGNASILAGTGASPLQIDGTAYLAGPYRGAPLSMVVVTPAVAGPFDLGTSVVRVALFLDPETARIRAVSDPIPDVFGGAKLDVDSLAITLDRREFSLNGTRCEPSLASAGTVAGGGADPAAPAAFSSVAVSAGFERTGCEALPFKPQLGLRVSGATRRAQHPGLRATLMARGADANIGTASVALPHALFLDQASLGSICTRVQFAAHQCPKGSVYGTAKAYTPLLDKPLEGPVYLRASEHSLPDLVAHLEGQVGIDLVGRIDSYKGGIRTAFNAVPDVPVSKFVLAIPGGKHGLLVASTNLCAKPIRAIVRINAQNGKKANARPPLRVPCGKKKKRS
jgi:hypothetical protein